MKDNVAPTLEPALSGAKGRHVLSESSVLQHPSTC